MISWIKLAAFALFAYFLYEAMKGISQPRPRQAAPRVQERKEMFKAVPVYESSGGRRTQRVGRGVVVR